MPQPSPKATLFINSTVFAGKLWSVEKLLTAAIKRVWNHLVKTLRVIHSFIGDQFVSNVFNALRCLTFPATSNGSLCVPVEFSQGVNVNRFFDMFLVGVLYSDEFVKVLCRIILENNSLSSALQTCSGWRPNSWIQSKRRILNHFLKLLSQSTPAWTVTSFARLSPFQILLCGL